MFKYTRTGFRFHLRANGIEEEKLLQGGKPKACPPLGPWTRR